MIKKLILILMLSVMGYAGLSSNANAGSTIFPKVISLTSIGGAFFDHSDGWTIDIVNSNSVQYECGEETCSFNVSNRNFNNSAFYGCPEGAVVAISQNAIHIPKECGDD
ncbi:MAG TPA: hypothetical protein VLB82_03275 [Thermodesulfobacteriota bacterium]|nr:hypothetical protein [Thermodesulfobacteriota bacterium]